MVSTWRLCGAPRGKWRGGLEAAQAQPEVRGRRERLEVAARVQDHHLHLVPQPRCIEGRARFVSGPVSTPKSSGTRVPIPQRNTVRV